VSIQKIRFDGWVLDPDSGDLEHAGVRTRLQEQPVLVLKELIAHAGEVVTREHLIGVLWPKGVVDFDTGLNTLIRKLRSALGDTSETPRYIETLPRRGYRFIGALDPDPEAASATTPGVPMFTASGASPGPAPAAHEWPTAIAESALATAKPMPSGLERTARDEATSSSATTTAPVWRLRLPVLIGALAGAGLLTGVYALWRARLGTSFTSVRVEAPAHSGLPANVRTTPADAFAPPTHSIAVLPFVNLSGDKEQEYFSDGLTEELLNSLTHIDGLQVAARTSSFTFREHPDIAEVAHKLNVATVLEGSVRHSGHTVRISAQLINAVTGFHQWSKTYDRDLGDVLKLQTEIATAVASALKVTLLGDEAAKIEVGGTHNPGAFDAYLRATKTFWSSDSPKLIATVVTGYTEAIRLDPDYALAYAARSLAFAGNATHWDTTTSAVRADLDKAQADAAKAIALAPDLSEGYLARAVIYAVQLEFKEAGEDYERALALAPGNARGLRDSGSFAVNMGRNDSGLTALRRAVVLDPLNHNSHAFLGDAMTALRRYPEALAAYKEAEALVSTTPNSYLGFIGSTYYLLGDFETARATCEQNRDASDSQVCLALAYDKLGRHADAEAELKEAQTALGDAGTYIYTQIYAQWGNRPKALEWLETAMRWRDPGLIKLKTDPLLDPLRKEPRLQAIERALKFPN
jgi:TolB-like protein/DNA-binding winged helix-turn-helix (wHTH) protein/tetratricopeptide (TPR) repeat protein